MSKRTNWGFSFLAVLAINICSTNPSFADVKELACPSAEIKSDWIFANGRGSTASECRNDCVLTLAQKVESFYSETSYKCEGRQIFNEADPLTPIKEECKAQTIRSEGRIYQPLSDATESNIGEVSCSCSQIVEKKTVCVQENPIPYLPSPEQPKPTKPDGEAIIDSALHWRCTKIPANSDFSGGFKSYGLSLEEKLADPDRPYVEISGLFHNLAPTANFGIGLMQINSANNGTVYEEVGPKTAGLFLNFKVKQFSISCGFGINVPDEYTSLFN